MERPMEVDRAFDGQTPVLAGGDGGNHRGFEQPGGNGPSDQSVPGATMQEILERLGRIENALVTLTQLRTVKDFYSTDEVAGILGKAEFTVREWCRHGRIHAQKRRSGRGKYQSWVIAHGSSIAFSGKGYYPKTERIASCWVDG